MIDDPNRKTTWWDVVPWVLAAALLIFLWLAMRDVAMQNESCVVNAARHNEFVTRRARSSAKAAGRKRTRMTDCDEVPVEINCLLFATTRLK